MRLIVELHLVAFWYVQHGAALPSPWINVTILRFMWTQQCCIVEYSLPLLNPDIHYNVFNSGWFQLSEWSIALSCQNPPLLATWCSYLCLPNNYITISMEWSPFWEVNNSSTNMDVWYCVHNTLPFTVCMPCSAAIQCMSLHISDLFSFLHLCQIICIVLMAV